MDNLIFLQLPRVGEGCQTLGIDFDFTGRRFAVAQGSRKARESDVVLPPGIFLFENPCLFTSSFRNPAFPGYALWFLRAQVFDPLMLRAAFCEGLAYVRLKPS